MFTDVRTFRPFLRTLQAPVAAGWSDVENGVEAENTSATLKNWRHTMGPSQFSSAQDDGVRTHFFSRSVRPAATRRGARSGCVGCLQRSV